MSEIASAPAPSTARAITVISVTLGDSLTISGSFVAARTARTTSSARRGSVPNATPPSLTFGQEMLSSMPARPSTPSRRAASSA